MILADSALKKFTGLVLLKIRIILGFLSAYFYFLGVIRSHHEEKSIF